MLQQVRYCKSKCCKMSLVACDYRIKYQKCVPCGKAVVYEAYEHPVVEPQPDTRGICDSVKKVINDIISFNFTQRSFFKIIKCLTNNSSSKGCSNFLLI